MCSSSFSGFSLEACFSLLLLRVFVKGNFLRILLFRLWFSDVAISVAVSALQDIVKSTLLLPLFRVIGCALSVCFLSLLLLCVRFNGVSVFVCFLCVLFLGVSTLGEFFFNFVWSLSILLLRVRVNGGCVQLGLFG